MFRARLIDPIQMDLRHAQRAAGAHDFADGLEAPRLGGAEKIDFIFRRPLLRLNQRGCGAGPGRIGYGAEEPAVKEAILLRELASEIRSNNAPPGRDLVDLRVDMAQEALVGESVPDALDIVRIARSKLLGRYA